MHAEGGCACGAVRYQLLSRPMFVNCCHCSWCQRETGSAFVINAIIEADRMDVRGAVEIIDTPSESGKGQKIARCGQCHVALWSHYSGAGSCISFIRVGTLDDPSLCPPDAFIFTRSKQPWVVLPDNIPAFPIFYDMKTQWPAESLARRDAARAKGK
ncbi:MAG TPA: GFA family protein [Rhizomicrobium sp.]|nr:GFA family protein [Rhizomicrobium sp.]